MKTKKLVAALELLQREVSVLDSSSRDHYLSKNSHRDEAMEIVSEFLEEIYAQGHVAELERRVESSKKVDVESIQTGLEAMRKYKSDWVGFGSKDQNLPASDLDDLIKKVQEALDVIKNNQTRLGSMEVMFRLELYFDSEFDRLLRGFSASSSVFKEIKELVLVKLEKIKADDILLLWARAKASFKVGDLDRGFVLYPDIIPKGFFDHAEKMETIVERLSELIVRLKPLTVKRMLAEGFKSYPLGPFGVARALSVSPDAELLQITNMDILVVKSIAKVVALIDQISPGEKKSLARSLGVQSDGFIFDGEYFQDFKSQIDNLNVEKLYELLIAATKRLIEYVDEVSISRSKISSALWHYKLGQEVIAPSRSKAIIKGRVSEVALQKELCKYLVEREILSFGRTFGRSQVDLYSQEGGEDFVIEAKVFKSKLSARQIENNLVQLISYMDQVNQPRGVLAIFNCTNDLLISQRKWIRGRIWILAINLCFSAPSKRKRSIEISESTVSNRIVDFVENGGGK